MSRLIDPWCLLIGTREYLKRVHVVLVEIVDLSVDVVDPGLADCDSSGLYFKREILVQSHPLGPPRQLPIAVDTIASRIYTGAANQVWSLPNFRLVTRLSAAKLGSSLWD